MKITKRIARVKEQLRTATSGEKPELEARLKRLTNMWLRKRGKDEVK